jgi:hypothetical protein
MGRRLGIAVLSAVTLALGSALLWLACAAGAAAISPKQGLLLIGYTQIALIPIGALLGGAAGLGFGLSGWLNRFSRWMWVLLACGAIGLLVNAVMAFLVSGT